MAGFEAITDTNQNDYSRVRISAVGEVQFQINKTEAYLIVVILPI
jgi:hypothetical protein